MGIDGNVIQDFIEAIKEPPTDQNRTYSATVSRIDTEGVAWVHLAGSEIETPTALSASEVKAGDDVNVEWRNNKLYIASNVSDPSAGVVRMVKNEEATKVAWEQAKSANDAAGQAWQHAENAQTAAETAWGFANDANTAANDAQTSADNAQTSANNASTYAARALSHLSTVQDVAQTLEWITAHGTMTLTTDTAIDPAQVYFVADTDGEYVVGSSKYSIVPEPNSDDLSTYYVLSIDESLNNYVMTHLALMDDGLHVIGDNSDYTLVVTPSGIQIRNISTNEAVATYGSAITLGINNTVTTIDDEKMDCNRIEFTELRPKGTGLVLEARSNGHFSIKAVS